MVGSGGQAWRDVPVFVGSTFRDMDDERDLLQRVVVPVVNNRLGPIRDCRCR